MAKKKTPADVAKAVEKQARAKKPAAKPAPRRSKGGELDVRESKAFDAYLKID